MKHQTKQPSRQDPSEVSKRDFGVLYPRYHDNLKQFFVDETTCKAKTFGIKKFGMDFCAQSGKMFGTSISTVLVDSP